MNSVPIKFSDVQLAFEFANFDGGGASIAYIGLDTGKTYLNSEYIDETLEDIPDDLETSDRYIALPSKRDLRLGRNLALAFIEETAPGDYDTVEGFFYRKGAYSRFKGLLEARGLLQRWYDFENNAEQRALREWCEENGIQLLPE
jgi:hypothetical protein